MSPLEDVCEAKGVTGVSAVSGFIGMDEVLDQDVLAYHHAARAQVDDLKPGRIARGTQVMLWGLRAYVVFMAVVVAVQVAHSFH